MGFDHVALAYRPLERLVFGDALQRARVAHIGECLAERDLLLLGDGDGRFLEALLLAAARIEGADLGRVISVDTSARMLELARARVAGLPGADRVEFACCPVNAYRPPAGFHPRTVVAQFFFDCFSDAELAALLDQIGAWVLPEARLVVTDFALPREGRLRRLFSEGVISFMYRFFKLAAGLHVKALPDIHNALIGSGWREISRTEWRSGLLVSGVWRRACDRVERS